MTKEEAVAFFKEGNMISDEEFEALKQRVRSGEAICLSGPTQSAYDFVETEKAGKRLSGEELRKVVDKIKQARNTECY